MSNLRSQLEQITETFVSAVLSALKSAPLSDLANEAGRTVSAAPAKPQANKTAQAAEPVAKPAKRGRRRASAAQVQAQKDTALGAAKTLKPGFAKSDVMKKSGSKVDLGRALSLLVDEGKLTKQGDRRKTRYWVK